MFCLQLTNIDLNSLLLSSILFIWRLNIMTYLNRLLWDIYSTGLIFWNCFVKYGINEVILIMLNDYCPFYSEDIINYWLTFFNIIYKHFNGTLNHKFFFNISKHWAKKCGTNFSKNDDNCNGLRHNYLIALVNFF